MDKLANDQSDTMIGVLDEERQDLGGRESTLQEIVDDAATDRDSFVYCAICSNAIAREADRLEVSGSHDHHFSNPLGIQFHIGCFTDALGCTISGEPVAADTWFPGFRWRLATCAECHQHLGWYFEQADTFFYGLILDRIQND
jgi:hypothetical protein